MNMKPSSSGDPSRPMPQNREDIGGQTGNSPLELQQLDNIFGNDGEVSREEIAQRYAENPAPSYPQNVHPGQDFSARREYEPEQGMGYRYAGESSIRQGNRQDPQAHAAVTAPRHWSSHPPPHRPGYPPRRPPVAATLSQQEGWPSSTSQPSPMRQRMPLQQHDPQFAAGIQHPARPRDGYPYSPQPSPYGAYQAPYYQQHPRSFHDPRQVDYRFGGYPPSYQQPPPFNYYAHEQRYHLRGNLEPSYRPGDLVPQGAGPILPSQPPLAPFGNSPFPFIENVNENDVLCGRGGATNSHTGNRSYRKLVKKYKDKYLKAKKKQKPYVAAEVVNEIRNLDPPGRFLKKDKDTGYYLDIGDARAKEKTSQALREGAPQIRKMMNEGKKEGGVSGEETSPEKSASVSVESGPGPNTMDRKLLGDDTISAFSAMQQSQSIVKSNLESASKPDNSSTSAVEYKRDEEGKGGEQSKKRPSPMRSDEESDESPLKRRMTEPGPAKKDDPFRDMFDPPQTPIHNEDEEGEIEKVQEEKPKSL